MYGDFNVTRCRLRRSLLVLLVVLAGVASAPLAVGAQGPTVDEGKALFQQKCSGCHSVGGGDLVGPDLKGVTEQRSPEWLAQWIANPPKMVADGDPTAVALLNQYPIQMPNLGLSADQIGAILAYLGEASGGSAEAAPPAAALPAGDPAAGKAFFIGQQRFSNGGPPCMACHSIAGIGALGGGQLGPDLTGVSGRLGGSAGLAAFVSHPTTATMSAVWNQTPLTEQEVADLVGFVQQGSVSQRPGNTVAQLTLLAIGTALLLLGVGQLVWRKRLTGVRRRMVAAARR